MKRVLAILAVTGVVLGGGAAAFAATKDGPPSAKKAAIQALTPEQRATLKACVKQARQDHKGDRPAVRDAVKACFASAGIDLPKLSEAAKAARGQVKAQVKALPADKKAALKACVKQARQDHKGDRPAVRDAVKACFASAGITLPAPPG